jgi:hypothetical protein
MKQFKIFLEIIYVVDWRLYRKYTYAIPTYVDLYCKHFIEGYAYRQATGYT